MPQTTSRDYLDRKWILANGTLRKDLNQNGVSKHVSYRGSNSSLSLPYLTAWSRALQIDGIMMEKSAFSLICCDFLRFAQGLGDHWQSYDYLKLSDFYLSGDFMQFLTSRISRKESWKIPYFSPTLLYHRESQIFIFARAKSCSYAGMEILPMHEPISPWLCFRFSDHKSIGTNLWAGLCTPDVNRFRLCSIDQKRNVYNQLRDLGGPANASNCDFREIRQRIFQISVWLVNRINKMCDSEQEKEAAWERKNRGECLSFGW
jgi:hypothetical protein